MNSIFVDKTSAIDREALRQYVFSGLKNYRDRVEAVIFAERHRDFFNTLHGLILASPDKDALLRVESQIKELPDFIETWIHTAVDTSERLEFFIASKATEIKSGDQNHDYFWALQIRHDQLVGLIRVLDVLVAYLEVWVTKKPEEVLADPVFLGISDHSVEKQVYYEAEKVHAEREQFLRK